MQRKMRDKGTDARSKQEGKYDAVGKSGVWRKAGAQVRRKAGAGKRRQVHVRGGSAAVGTYVHRSRGARHMYFRKDVAGTLYEKM